MLFLYIFLKSVKEPATNAGVLIEIRYSENPNN